MTVNNLPPHASKYAGLSDMSSTLTHLLKLISILLLWNNSAQAVVCPEPVNIHYGDKQAITLGTNIRDGDHLSINPAGPFVSNRTTIDFAARDIVTINGLALISHIDSGLAVMDIQQLNAPQLIMHYETALPITSLAVADDYAYLLLDRRILEIVDISMPSKPFSVSMYGLSETYNAIVAKQGHLYLASNNGLEIRAIASPDKVLSRFQTAQPLLDIAVTNHIAFLAQGTSGITSVDISDIHHINWLGSHSNLGDVQHLLLNEDKLFVMNKSGDLFQLDLSQPGLPTVLSFFHNSDATAFAYHTNHSAADNTNNDKTTHGKIIALSGKDLLTIDITAVAPLLGNEGLDIGQGVNFGGQRRMAINNNIAYVADWFSGLHLYDISDITNPQLLATYHSPGSPKGVVIKNKLAYVADDDHGLAILDVSDPKHPRLLTRLLTSGLAYTPVIKDNLLYLASHRGGFQIIDINTPVQPQLLSDTDTPGKAWSLAINGNYAYIADDSSGLLIYDISRPENPVKIASYNPGGLAEDVRIKGKFAYVTFFDRGLNILDISSPENPISVAQLSTPGNARGITLDGDRAYIADWLAGFQIIDITDPYHPEPIGSYDSRGATWGVYHREGHALLADWWGGLTIVDVKNPHRPVLVKRLHGSETTYASAVSGHYIYVANGTAGLQIFDINNALNPTWITGLPLSGITDNIILNNHHAYLVSNNSNLTIVDVDDPFAPAVLSRLELKDKIDTLQILNNRAYLNHRLQGISVINVANPQTPELITRLDIKANDIWVDGQWLYSIDQNRINVYDINHPETASYLTSIDIAGTGKKIRAQGKTIYSVSDHGLDIFVATNKRFRLVRHVDLGDQLTDFFLDDTTLYGIGKGRGLILMDISEPQQTRTISRIPVLTKSRQLHIHNQVAYLSGENILAAIDTSPLQGLLRDTGNQTNLSNTSQLPIGDYDLEILSATKQTVVCHQALKITMPATGNSGLSMEQFEHLLQKHLQQSEP